MSKKIMCAQCLDIIESKHRHDFVSCTCGEVYIDGGNDYFRAGAKNLENFVLIDDHAVREK